MLFHFLFKEREELQEGKQDQHGTLGHEGAQGQQGSQISVIHQLKVKLVFLWGKFLLYEPGGQPEEKS